MCPTGPLAYWVEHSAMSRETSVQSKVESYRRFKNDTWYLLAEHSALFGTYLMCPSLHLRVVAIEKRTFGSPSTTFAFTFLIHKKFWKSHSIIRKQWLKSFYLGTAFRSLTVYVLIRCYFVDNISFLTTRLVIPKRVTLLRIFGRKQVNIIQKSNCTQ